MSAVFVKYVSSKTKCVKWFPTLDLATDRPGFFVTGSWDNRVNLIFSEFYLNIAHERFYLF